MPHVGLFRTICSPLLNYKAILKSTPTILPVQGLFHTCPENPVSPVLDHKYPHHTPQTLCAAVPQIGITHEPVCQEDSLERKSYIAIAPKGLTIPLPKPGTEYVCIYVFFHEWCWYNILQYVFYDKSSLILQRIKFFQLMVQNTVSTSEKHATHPL
jgi:hypothetical protein